MPTPAITSPRLNPEACPFALISDSIRTRLSDYCGIDSSYVYPVANDGYKIATDENFFLYYQIFSIDAFGDTGGGRRNPWATRRLRVYVYTRSSEDIAETDVIALQGNTDSMADANATAGSIGQFYAEELVIGALFNWMPTGTVNNSAKRALCLEPFHPAGGSGPPLRKAEDDDGLIRTSMDFEIKYSLSLDNNDPAH